jgi:glutaminyl-peptide cyclotransferase
MSALPMTSRLSAAVVLVLAAQVLSGCGHSGAGGSHEAATVAVPEHLIVDVLGRIPVPPVFTEGLDLSNGSLYESSGLAGESLVRKVDPNTGAVEAARAVPSVFGEGIAVTGRHLWELTWKDRVVIERDSVTLDEIRRIPLTGAVEGWGACADGQAVFTSDGTARIAVRDRETFSVQRYIDVRDNHGPVSGLNELDCARPDQLWANVWPSDRLIRIDADGRVTGEADLSELHRQTGLDAPDDVPNGIATIPATDTAFLTGKQWPYVLKVRIAPASSTSVEWPR